MKTILFLSLLVACTLSGQSQDPLNIWSSGHYSDYTYEENIGENESDHSYNNGNFTLPVTWISINTICQEDIALCQWDVASEENLSGYIIEMYVGNGIWEHIDFVCAKGNQGSLTHYEYIVDFKKFNSNHIRVTPVDFDGSKNEARILNMECNESFTEQLSKPVIYVDGSTLSININSKYNSNSVISIYSIDGRLLESISFSANEGSNTVQLPWNHSSQKIIVKAESKGFSVSEKFFIN